MAASTSARCIPGESGLNSGKSAGSERPAQPPIKCPECGSSRIWKDGLRYVRGETGTIAVQRYICRECGRRFSEDTAKIMPAPRGRVGSNATPREDVDLFESYLEPNRRGYNRSRRKIRSSSDGYTGTEAGRGGETLPVSNTYQIGVADPEGDRGRKGQVYTLSQKSRILKRAAGATKLSEAEVKGKLIDYSWYMKKNGYPKSTIKFRTGIIKTLINRGAPLLDPEAMKGFIAKQEVWGPGRKSNVVYAYNTFLKMEGLTWEPPRYRPLEKLPFVPLESELDKLIAATSKTVSTFLQALKQTGADPGELIRLRWIDINKEARSVAINHPVKRHNPRILPVSTELIRRLEMLPKRSERIFTCLLHSMQGNYRRQRKRIARQFVNPRLLKIVFTTFRHWKATMEYHRTKDILYVMKMLGHKGLQNTLVYIDLETAIYGVPRDDEFTVRVATTLEEACEFLEAGFEYVTDMDGHKLFRKRK